MRGYSLCLAACVFAAVMPLIPWKGSPEQSEFQFPGWPSHYENRSLKQLALSEREQRFARGFPGRIAKFTDGRRTIVMRWVRQRTRKLHPATDCFRGIGYAVKPLPVRVDSQGNLWGSIECSKGNEKTKVCERIRDEAGRSWADVSSWYWGALLGGTDGPWWATTVVERL